VSSLDWVAPWLGTLYKRAVLPLVPKFKLSLFAGKKTYFDLLLVAIPLGRELNDEFNHPPSCYPAKNSFTAMLTLTALRLGCVRGAHDGKPVALA